MAVLDGDGWCQMEKRDKTSMRINTNAPDFIR